MKIEEYLGTLPENILNGEDVLLGPGTLREIFRFADLGEDDTFYHLGCGDHIGVKIARTEYNVKRAVGIDCNMQRIQDGTASLASDGIDAEMICQDVTEADISDASVILFWFADEGIIGRMMERFGMLNPGTRIVTVWGPLPGCLPDRVRFPYVINRVPFKSARSMQEQLLAVFGVKCVDFVTAWEFAERYTKALSPGVKNDRFLTIIQTLTIWINAWNLGVACEDEVPESIRTYIGIMNMHFDIDFAHMLE